jgi:hypothetical protein
MQYLIWIPVVIIYMFAFRLIYMQFRLAKILREHGFNHYGGLSLKSHDNIKIARNIASKIEADAEQSYNPSQQTPADSGGQVWAYGQYGSPEEVRLALVRGEITRKQAIQILEGVEETAPAPKPPWISDKELSEKLLITANQLERSKKTLLKIVVVFLILGVIYVRMS